MLYMGTIRLMRRKIVFISVVKNLLPYTKQTFLRPRKSQEIVIKNKNKTVFNLSTRFCLKENLSLPSAFA